MTCPLQCQVILSQLSYECMSTEFIHLQVHSEYSIVDGLLHVGQLVAAAGEMAMPAVALTDIMNLYGAVKFYKAAIAAGIKPIFGCEVWLANASEPSNPYRVTMLCQNNQGYKQLTKLISKAFLQSKARVSGIPIVEFSWLEQENLNDVIVLSGGRQGDIGLHLLNNDLPAANASIQYWQQHFPGRFYLELRRLGFSDDTSLIQHKLKLATEYQVPVVASQAARFLRQEDFSAHEVRTAIYSSYTLEDNNRPRLATEQQFLTTPDEMAKLFQDLPEALANSVEIAKRCNVTFELGKACLPEFPVPEGLTVAEHFYQVAHQSLTNLMPTIDKYYGQSDAKREQSYRQRLDKEIEVIVQMGYPGYFLIVADFIQWAKDQGIPVGPGRGSGAGSLVAYVLKITDIDPLPYDLLFERFLNPERVSMPDFDIDFCMEGRDRVIEYVATKYGRESVSQIITFGSMAARAVVRDVGRVLGHPYGFVDSIAKLVPNDLGMTLTKALDDEPMLKSRYDSEQDVAELIDMALKLEGTVRNVGKHAGGVVIAPSKLTDFTPIYCEEGSQALVSQFDKDDVEEVGLVKFDFLGLRNLTIIDNAVRIINAKRQAAGQQPVIINEIPLNDRPTFALLKKHQTTGVFQLESRGMKDLIRRLQPDSFEDIIALVALFRPGPLQSGMVDDFINRKHGRAKVEYPHAQAAPALKATYGIILYQEQVMMLAQNLANYTLGGADLLRRAMGKKKADEMAKHRAGFVAGAKDNGIDEQTATYIFDLVEKFAGYGFNKSHSAAYAYIAYQTAWLKAHYPAEFMAAVLSSDMDNTDKVVNFLEDAQHIGLQVLPPDINSSVYSFSAVSEQAIRYGLGAIKGVGRAAIDSLVQEREQNGKFSDLFDLTRRIGDKKVNRRLLEALIHAGALDELASNRATLLASLHKALRMAEQYSSNHAIGQNDLFASWLTPEQNSQGLDYVQTPPMPAQQRLSSEKQVLGLFLSGHPLDFYQQELKALSVTTISQLRPTGKDKPLTIAGIVMSKRRIKTKSGKVMHVVTLDDSTGRVEVTVFPEQAEKFSEFLLVDKLLIVDGDVAHDDFSGGWRVAARHIDDIIGLRLRYCRELFMHIDGDTLDQQQLTTLKSILLEHKGALAVLVGYNNKNAQVRLKLGYKVNPTDDLLAALAEIKSLSAISFVAL